MDFKQLFSIFNILYITICTTSAYQQHSKMCEVKTEARCMTGVAIFNLASITIPTTFSVCHTDKYIMK